MRIDEAEASLRSYFIARELVLEDSDPPAASTAMMDWYAQRRALDAAALEEDGDMLLFQWGERDWGAGRSFEYDLTRQLIRADEQEDEGILQLSLTFRFPTSSQSAHLVSGNRWCASPAGLARFRREVEAHPASAIAGSSTAQEVVVTWGVAG